MKRITVRRLPVFACDGFPVPLRLAGERQRGFRVADIASVRR